MLIGGFDLSRARSSITIKRLLTSHDKIKELSGEGMPSSIADELFAGDSEMAAMMRSIDWSTTPLGPVERWPQSLKTSVRIILTSRQPMFVWWGRELINLYNDAYRSILCAKHPHALGQPASIVWKEIWDNVGPRAEYAMRQNEGTYDEALLLIMERSGYPEETYYTFSYSPVPNDQGGTGGILCANTDDTQRIIGTRRLDLLRDLAAQTAQASNWQEVCILSARSLEADSHDLPFAMIYILDPDNHRLALAGTAGIARGHRAAPENIDLDSTSIWPFAEAIRSQSACLSELSGSGDLPTGFWQIPPAKAVTLPIVQSGQSGKTGILVIGLNPFRLFDDDYRGFLGLVAGHISASIAHAEAYEQERKRAEALAEIDRAKTIFFSNVSHEFRTPLTLMLGPLSDLLAQESSSSIVQAEREQVELAHRNGLRLLKLVNSLLDFSRIEAGRFDSVYQPVDLAALTVDLASNFRSAIEKAGMRLRVNCPKLDVPVYVDLEMYEKIVLNLLSNAFKFTLEGEIEVALNPARDYVELSVRDTGVGIPAEEMPRLFERFYRSKGVQGRTYEGTGIGLALVQELVKLHGGSIRAHSVQGQGTNFIVSIPFGKSHLPSDKIQATRKLDSTAIAAKAYVEEALRWLPQSVPAGFTNDLMEPHASPSDMKKRRVLVADDNADMREYIRNLLESYYEVEAVSDGEAALGAMRFHPPDLVISDIMMPRMDGLELLRQIRSDLALRAIPIILLSARAGEEARIEGLERGADAYLVKPFSARALLAQTESNLKLADLRKENEKRYRTLFNTIDVGFCIIEMILDLENRPVDYRFLEVNAAFEEQTGLQAAEGKLVRELAPALEEHWFEIYGKIALTGEPAHFVNEARALNRWYDVYAYRVGAPESRQVAVLFNDISAYKQAEEALLQSRAELELRVQERTKELSQAVTTLHESSEQLRRMAAELTLTEQRERRQLAQVLHDGLQQILVGAKYRLASVPRSQNVLKATDQVRELIDDAIETSRSLTAELSPPILLQGDLSLALEWLVRWMHDKYELSVNLTAHKDIEPLTEGVLLLLFQAARELLFNVVKHAGVKAARVEVNQLDGHILMTVADEGFGFDPNQLRAKGGHSGGFGLFGINERLSYMGGRMEIDSSPGRGSQFKLVLPHASIDAEMDRISAEKQMQVSVAVSSHTTKPADSTRKINVVLVDDHLVVRQGLAGLLRMEPDFEIAGEASDGESAVHLVRERRPDVVLMDISMPGMDGIQATRIIHKELPEVRVIGLSMFQEGQQQAAMREAGAVNYLTKSGPSETLIEAIRDCVRVSEEIDDRLANRKTLKHKT